MVRVRYAPQTEATSGFEAIRGVDTAIPASALFSDIDVDEHQAESGDFLSYEILDPGTSGGASVDGSGIVHYRSIDVVTDSKKDFITVRAADRWGATAEARVEIDIAEVIRSCVRILRVHARPWASRHLHGHDHRGQQRCRPRHATHPPGALCAVGNAVASVDYLVTELNFSHRREPTPVPL